MRVRHQLRQAAPPAAGRSHQNSPADARRATAGAGAATAQRLRQRAVNCADPFKRLEWVGRKHAWGL
jgi:hypothetical protein